MSTLNLKIFEIHVCNQRKNRYYSAVQNLFHDCRGAALCPFTASRKGLRHEMSSLLLMSKPLYCCMDACRWHFIFLFLLGWNFHCCTWQIKQGRTDMGSCALLAGTVGTITQFSGRSEFNSHRHGCVDIGIALIVFLPSSKTIGNSLHISSLTKAMWHHSVRVVTWLVYYH